MNDSELPENNREYDYDFDSEMERIAAMKRKEDKGGLEEPSFGATSAGPVLGAAGESIQSQQTEPASQAGSADNDNQLAASSSGETVQETLQNNSTPPQEDVSNELASPVFAQTAGTSFQYPVPEEQEDLSYGPAASISAQTTGALQHSIPEPQEDFGYGATALSSAHNSDILQHPVSKEEEYLGYGPTPGLSAQQGNTFSHDSGRLYESACPAPMSHGSFQSVNEWYSSTYPAMLTYPGYAFPYGSQQYGSAYALMMNRPNADAFNPGNEMCGSSAPMMTQPANSFADEQQYYDKPGAGEKDENVYDPLLYNDGQ